MRLWTYGPKWDSTRWALFHCAQLPDVLVKEALESGFHSRTSGCEMSDVDGWYRYGLLDDSDEDEETSMTRGPPSRLGSSTGIDSRPQGPQSAGKQQTGPSSPAQADDADGMQEGATFP